jgi:hypothetical protein
MASRNRHHTFRKRTGKLGHAAAIGSGATAVRADR